MKNTTPELILFTGHSNDILLLSFSPDGKQIATTGADKCVILWDVETGEMIHKITGLPEWTYSTTFSPDGDILITSNWEETRFWDSRTGELLFATFDVSGGVALSPDGRYLAAQDSGEKENHTVLWNIQDRKIVRKLPYPSNYLPGALSFSKDGSILVAAMDDGILLYDLAKNSTVRYQTAPDSRGSDIDKVAISPDGKFAAGGSAVWDIMSGDILCHLSGRTMDVCFSPDGKSLAACDVHGCVTLWSTESREETVTIQAHDGWCRCLGFSPDGRLLASAGNDRVVKIWHACLHSLCMTSVAQEHKVNHIEWSRDGRTLVGIGADDTARTWDTHTFALENTTIIDIKPAPHIIIERDAMLTEAEKHFDQIISTATSPDGSTLAVGHVGFDVSLWDIQTGASKGVVKTEMDSPGAIAFSPDGKTLAIGTDYDDIVQLFSTQTRREKRRLVDHTNSISSVAFSPDGKTLATASRDGSVKLWNPRNGELLVTLLILPDELEPSEEWIAYTPDGRWNRSRGASRFIRWKAGNDIFPADAVPQRDV